MLLEYSYSKKVMIIGIILCFYFYLLCYAAVLINFTYYAHYYAHVKDLCLGINFCYKTFLLKTVLLEYINIVTVLLEYIDLLVLIFSSKYLAKCFLLCWHYA